MGLDLQGGSYLLLEIDNKPVITKELQNKITFLKQFTYTILLTLLVNVIRLSILTIFVKTANADSFSIFDFMHGGNGSLVFSLISMFLCCESYKKIYLKT